MKFSIAAAILLFTPTITFAHPQVAPALQQRDAFAAILDQPASEVSDHWKRKGGGGGGGKGGGGGSSGGKSGGSSSSSSSGSSSGSSSSSGRTSGSSIAGGATKSGSGAPRGYGGGRYYGGGAAVPYSSGGKSPRGLIAVPFLGAGLLVFPALALYGAYSYPYYHPYTYYNRTARRNRTASSTTTAAAATGTPTRRSLVERFFEIEMRQTTDLGVNETKPVTCLCAKYSVCGCDDNGDTTFLDSIIGDGDYAKLNHTLVQVADVNGTSTILIDGTLPNGTTASGGEDDALAATGSAATSLSVGGSITGYFVMIAIVGFTCFLV